MLHIILNTGKPVCAVPQNALTPTDIYNHALKGNSLDALRVLEDDFKGAPAEQDWDIPIAQRRGVERADLYEAQESFRDSLEKTRDESQKAFNRSTRRRAMYINKEDK